MDENNDSNKKTVLNIGQLGPCTYKDMLESWKHWQRIKPLFREGKREKDKHRLPQNIKNKKIQTCTIKLN